MCFLFSSKYNYAQHKMQFSVWQLIQIIYIYMCMFYNFTKQIWKIENVIEHVEAIFFLEKQLQLLKLRFFFAQEHRRESRKERPANLLASGVFLNVDSFVIPILPPRYRSMEIILGTGKSWWFQHAKHIKMRSGEPDLFICRLFLDSKAPV